MHQPSISRYARGVMGEDTACACLQRQGMQLLERRYRGGQGEIDLILLDGDVLALVEVKTRERGTTMQGQWAVTPDKQRRMVSAACAYLGQHPEHAGRMVRFDIVTVTPEGVHHLPNAFTGAEW